jgi:hypothetical protein
MPLHSVEKIRNLGCSEKSKKIKKSDRIFVRSDRIVNEKYFNSMDKDPSRMSPKLQKSELLD